MELRKPEVKFLGHVTSKEGLKPDPAKAKAVEEMPQQTSKQEVLSLLEFINYLSRFLPRLADVAQPLRDLTSKDAKFTWAKLHETDFKEVKKLLVSQSILKDYDCNAEVTLQYDASEKGLGAVLLQNGRPVTFASKTLSTTERRYAQIERVSCNRVCQSEVKPVLIQTRKDHTTIRPQASSVLAAPCRLQGMVLRLQRFDLEVTYKPGSQMCIADQIILQEPNSPAKERKTKSFKCLR